MEHAKDPIYLWLIPSIPILALTGIWLGLYLRYGTEPAVGAPAGPVREAPSDWTPVQLAILWNHGRVHPRDALAAMFDLVRRGALRLIAEPASGQQVEPDGGSYHLFLERVPERSGDLAADERHLVDEVLFCQWPRAPRVSLRDVMIEGARRSREVCGRMDEWRQMAERGPLPFPFEDPASERASRIGIAVGIVMLGLAYAVGCLFESPLAVAAIVFGALMIVGSRLIRRRTPEAADALARWTAFRRHLCASGVERDQSLIPADTRWRHLTHAVTLGVAEYLIDQFRLLYPSHENVADSAAVYTTAFSPESDFFSRTLVELAATGTPGAGAGPD